MWVQTPWPEGLWRHMVETRFPGPDLVPHLANTEWDGEEHKVYKSMRLSSIGPWTSVAQYALLFRQKGSVIRLMAQLSLVEPPDRVCGGRRWPPQPSAPPVEPPVVASASPMEPEGEQTKTSFWTLVGSILCPSHGFPWGTVWTFGKVGFVYPLSSRRMMPDPGTYGQPSV